MIGVLGATGFVGQNLCKFLTDYGVPNCGASRRTGVDARDQKSVKSWLSHNSVDTLVNLAAECGGIGLNKKSPADLWAATTDISSGVLKAAIDYGLAHLICIGTVCSYPKHCPVPFQENMLLWCGPPEETNLYYGMAKLSGLFGAQAYAKQYGLRVTNLIPENMYGPFDNFDLETSHVIPAMIRKIHEAKERGDESVSLWGTGSASRGFLHAHDFARAIYFATHKQSGPEFINVGSGTEITMAALADKIAWQLRYGGKILWDHSMPDGQPRRCLDISRAHSVLGFKPAIDLDRGLTEVVAWWLRGV